MSDAAPRRDGQAGGDGSSAADLGRPRSNGEDCDEDEDCLSRICADRVCCEGRCEGICRSCAIAGRRGECVLAREEDDPRQDCTGISPSCGGSCDGHGRCAYVAQGTPCAETSCAGGTLTSASCDGAGRCEEKQRSCGGYTCDAAGTSCRDSCGAGVGCTGTSQCVDDKCVNQLGLGESCGDNDLACADGHCVDEVCCQTESCAPCNACNLSTSRGQCAPVADGISCGAPSCSGGIHTVQLCASGSCELQTDECSPYACNAGGTDCLTACNAEGDCAPDNFCALTECLPKKQNGESCDGYQECLSDVCTAAEGVCCDSECSGECETCAGLDHCTPLPDNTPCGSLAPYCDDAPESSQIKVDQCDGARNCVAEVTDTCDPYRCVDQGIGPACATSCTAADECTSWLCEAIGQTGRCVLATQICYSTPPGNPTCPGNGTRTDPYCTIQACLDGPRAYVALADGTYPENLVIKSDVHLIASGTTKSSALKAAIVPPGVNTDGIDLTGGHTLIVYGVDLNFPEPSAPPAASDPCGPLIRADNQASLAINTSRIHRGNMAPCLAIKNSTVTLKDAVIESCSSRGISSEASTLTLHDVLFYDNSGYSVYHDGGKVTVWNATFRNNAGVSLQTFGTELTVYRLRAHANDDTVLSLSNNTHGIVGNVLSYDNGGSTLVLSSTGTPPLILNMTSVGNSGVEISCDVDTAIYNTILRDTDSQMYSGPCIFNYSAVKGGAGGQNIFTGDPLFDSAAAEPYSLSASSPCVDNGLDNIPNNSVYLDLDVLGNDRHVDLVPGGAVTDIGAFERQ